MRLLLQRFVGVFQATFERRVRHGCWQYSCMWERASEKAVHTAMAHQFPVDACPPAATSGPSQILRLSAVDIDRHAATGDHLPYIARTAARRRHRPDRSASRRRRLTSRLTARDGPGRPGPARPCPGRYGSTRSVSSAGAARDVPYRSRRTNGSRALAPPATHAVADNSSDRQRSETTRNVWTFGLRLADSGPDKTAAICRIYGSLMWPISAKS